MSNTAPVLDFMGREIKVNDTVCYPVRQGAKMWLQRIRVTQVVPGAAPKLGGFNNEGRKITIHKISNVVVVEPLPVPKV